MNSPQITVPMLSIEDVFTKQDVTDWIGKVLSVHPDAAFSVEHKIDGLSMTLRYRRDAAGVLSLYLAETRGSGFEGDDCTANARMIEYLARHAEGAMDAGSGTALTPEEARATVEAGGRFVISPGRGVRTHSSTTEKAPASDTASASRRSCSASASVPPLAR